MLLLHPHFLKILENWCWCQLQASVGIQSLIHEAHIPSPLKQCLLVLFKLIVGGNWDKYRKYVNTVEFFNVAADGSFIYHWGLKG